MHRITGRIFNSTFKCQVNCEMNKDIRFIDIFPFPYLKQHFYGAFQEDIFGNFMNWYSIRPDILLFSVSVIRPDVRQVKSGIRPDIGYNKKPDCPAGYPVHPFCKRDLNFKEKIPNAWYGGMHYPAFGLAVYPAKSVSGASLLLNVMPIRLAWSVSCYISRIF
jgi:hypothetical protein